MSDEESIRNAIARYFHHLDDRDYAAWADLLAEDCAIHLYGRVVEGRDACRAFIASGQVEGQRGRHLAANTAIDVDGDGATAVSDYFYLAKMGPRGHERFIVLDFGRYYDRLVRRDGAWFFAERRIDVELHRLDEPPITNR